MLIVEYAKYGNLRDYLRRKRPAGHALSGSYENSSDTDNNETESQVNDDNFIRSLTTIDLLLFCYQTASGMEYLHSKKVNNLYNMDDFVPFFSLYSSAFIVILLLEMFY